MSERVYYEINERSAKTAHEMMSMSNYKEGSKTREYRRCVDKIYDVADKVAKLVYMEKGRKGHPKDSSSPKASGNIERSDKCIY